MSDLLTRLLGPGQGRCLRDGCAVVHAPPDQPLQDGHAEAPVVDTSGDEPTEEKVARLTKELIDHFDESARLEAVVSEQLGRVDA